MCIVLTVSFFFLYFFYYSLMKYVAFRKLFYIEMLNSKEGSDQMTAYSRKSIITVYSDLGKYTQNSGKIDR